MSVPPSAPLPPPPGKSSTAYRVPMPQPGPSSRGGGILTFVTGLMAGLGVWS
jgi:hypothetical protein